MVLKEYKRYICIFALPPSTEGDFSLVGRQLTFGAREHVPQRAKWILRQIGKLYAVEVSLREIASGPNLRFAIRASHSAAIYRRIHRGLVAFKKSGHRLPRIYFGKAIDYALSNWTLLGVFL